jgi:hypothetical protein
MKLETLGWGVVIVFGVIAILLWSTLPKPALIVAAVVVVILVTRLLFARRM